MTPATTENRMLLKYAKKAFLVTGTSKSLLLLSVFFAVVYFFMLCFYFERGNTFLFVLLMIGEVFHLWQIFGYVQTIWRTEKKYKFDETFTPEIDVLIPVVGEPTEVVEETVRAALAMDYPKFNVFILNDGKAAKKDNWKEKEELAERLGIRCITRDENNGFKAGNINYGLKESKSPFFVVFDSDHVPHKDFLRKMVGYFVDERVGFVQSPQFYKNFLVNDVTLASWEQQTIFFGPILKGKNRLNSVFMCGTNMVLRRTAINEAGGMCEFNIAEDFLTSLFMHEKGWKSVYVPEVLAEGYAPEDFLSYYKQQFRWTRGSLEVIFKYNPLFRKGLSLTQKFQYLVSASYYFSGVITLMNALLPLFFLYFGLMPLTSSTMALAAIFIPYIILNLYVLQLSGNFSYSFRALSFSISSFPLHIKGVWAVLTNQKTAFAVTSKQQIEGNFLYLVIPHLLYIVVVIGGIAVAIAREGISASVVTNMSWAILYVAVFMPFILAAAPKFDKQKLFKGFRQKKTAKYNLLENKKI